MFAYCNNNPVNYADYTGTVPIAAAVGYGLVSFIAIGVVSLVNLLIPEEVKDAAVDAIVSGFREVVDVASETINECFNASSALTVDELEEIAKGYEIGECLQAAEAMQKKNGNRGHIIHLYFPNAHNGYVCSERYPSFAISTNGNHYGYLYENIVYCNIYPEGREQSMWINSFYDISGAVPIVNIY